jgi:hypothetical protein
MSDHWVKRLGAARFSNGGVQMLVFRKRCLAGNGGEMFS